MMVDDDAWARGAVLDPEELARLRSRERSLHAQLLPIVRDLATAPKSDRELSRAAGYLVTAYVRSERDEAQSRVKPSQLHEELRLLLKAVGEVNSRHRNLSDAAREWALLHYQEVYYDSADDPFLSPIVDTRYSAALGDSLASLEADGLNGRRGQPKKIVAASVATVAVRIFEAITGSRASISVNPLDHERSGPFLEFITAVFKTLSIEGSPEAQAQAAIKERNRQRPSD